MKISEIYNLNKSQFELDFVDIDINKDTALFLDPHFLSVRSDRWSTNCAGAIRDFFQHIINLVNSRRIAEARNKFGFLGEPNETCLGLSEGRPKGRGVGSSDANKIFESILRSRAIQTGIVEDLEDTIIFVDNIGKDKLSDMTTNIIKKYLIEYTQSQCELWNIEMQDNVPSGHFWNIDEKEWDNIYTRMLIIDDRKILLVPKGIVSYSEDYVPQKYHRHFVLNFLKDEHLRINSALVQRKKLKSGKVKRYVTKKDLEEKVAPLNKDFLRRFTEDHIEVFDDFKNNIAGNQYSLSNEEFGEINSEEVINHLIESLRNLPSGREDAERYHKLIYGILEFIFYPSLICPKIEQEIHQGRKRIDITFDNAAQEGFFNDLHRVHRLPCQYIFIECKNYSSDPTNPELDQLAGRFGPNKGEFGFLLCRTIEDMDLFLRRCSDTYDDNRGLIIPLVDSDLENILDGYKEGIDNPEDLVFRDRLRAVALN